MIIPVTEQELRVENPDNGSFKTMVHILNQFNEETRRDTVVGPKNNTSNASVATSQKWEGWYFGK
jgi:hypothetical protein